MEMLPQNQTARLVCTGNHSTQIGACLLLTQISLLLNDPDVSLLTSNSDINEWMHGWMEGYVVGWKGGWTDGRWMVG